MTQRQLGNGTKAKLAYDPSGRLNQVINTTSANVTLSSYDYALDGIGNFSSAVEDGTRPINWGADSLNQITSDYYFSSLTSESWMRMILAQWDSFTLADWDALPLDWLTSIVSGSNQVAYSPAGNRTTRIEQASGDTTTYAYSATNRLTAADDITGRTTYTHDSNGNTLSIEEPSGDLTTNTWDGENRLVQVEHPDGAITTYSYNADGQRVEEDHDGVIKRLVYDGNNVQLETDDVGDLLVDNTYVPNKYGMALSQRRDGDSSFYLADGTQDVRQLTDSVQSVTDEYEFDAWGNSLSSTGGTPNAQQYKGQQLAYRADPDAGPELQYALHFRQYDPHTARFTSRDPAEDDLNLYRYVKNNPVNNVDPSGLGDGFETLWSDWTEWVWGKSQAANEFLDQTPSTDPAEMLLKDAVKGGLGAMAHVATSHPDPPIRQIQDAAFSGGILANNSVVQTYDLLTNPGEIFDRAVGNGADQELASETIQKFAVSLDPQHAQYGQDAAGGLEALSTATGMASAVAPLKAVTEPMRPLKRLLRRFMKFGRSSPPESIDTPTMPAPKASVTNDPVTARSRKNESKSRGLSPQPAHEIDDPPMHLREPEGYQQPSKETVPSKKTTEALSPNHDVKPTGGGQFGLFNKDGTPVVERGQQAQRTFDTKDAAAKWLDLASDPAVGKLRPDEAATALRVEIQEQVNLRRFSPPPGGKGDWVDANGIVYDGCSPAPSAHFAKQWKNFTASLADHLGKVDKVVVDLTGKGLTPAQVKQVVDHINALPQVEKNRIVLLQ